MRDENMSYTVKSSERLRKSGSEAETKALLYLMNFRPDSDDIYYFVVDFFNDLTGMDNMASRLWDVQSKGAHHVSPKAIGKELVTLFKNYMSPLTFEAYILFIGSVTGSLRKDSSLTTFGIENVKDAAIEQIHHDLHRSRENRYHRTVQAGQANPGIMRRIQCLRTDDLSLGKTILPSGSR